ncbi:hypothetical protein Droror1_Dr00017635 [Drosera rotundifolia]
MQHLLQGLGLSSMPCISIRKHSMDFFHYIHMPYSLAITHCFRCQSYDGLYSINLISRMILPGTHIVLVLEQKVKRGQGNTIFILGQVLAHWCKAIQPLDSASWEWPEGTSEYGVA